jgi:hypothetical protein
MPLYTSCGKENPPEAEFCYNCGAKLYQRKELEAERKVVPESVKSSTEIPPDRLKELRIQQALGKQKQFYWGGLFALYLGVFMAIAALYNWDYITWLGLGSVAWLLLIVGILLFVCGIFCLAVSNRMEKTLRSEEIPDTSKPWQ